MQGCALHPLRARARAEAGFLRDGGVGPVAGDAVNPSLGARWRHPWRQRSCAAHPDRPPTVSCACQPRKRIKRSKAKAGSRCSAEPMPGCCTRNLRAEHGSALQKTFRSFFRSSTHGVDLPCRPRSTPTSAISRSGRLQEAVEGGVGPVAGVSAAWMPRPSPQGRVYGVPRNRTQPDSPQETSFCCCCCCCSSSERVQGAALPNTPSCCAAECIRLNLHALLESI